MATLVDQALEYASLGWFVLPGIPNTKRPFLPWAEASTDTTTVTKLFEKWPMAEILVLCGPSGLAVLDVDIYKAPIEARLPTYDTWVAETPKGGRQYVFADPSGKIPTTAGRINEWTDTRGVGGLIVVPSVNAPKRRWTKRGKMAPWPTDLPSLGAPLAQGTEHTDEFGSWAPALSGMRLPNEDCPGSYHLTTGRQPRLGVRLMPDGRYWVSCWSGCDDAEVHAGLIDAGRYRAEELWRPEEVATTEAVDPSFITVADLMAIRPPEWLIEPYIQENALIMLAAKFNTGKTFVAVNWALELAARQKRVLYLALEGLTGLQSRVRAWKEHYGSDIGTNILFNRREFCLNLLNESQVSGLCRAIQQSGGFDLVVLDNLGEAVPGDENDSETVGRAMQALNLIRTASGGAVLDLHNSGHGGTVRARGHSKMLDTHDTVIYLEAIEGSLHGLKIISGKERNAERFVTRRAQLLPKADSLVAVMGAAAMAQSNPFYNAVKLGHTDVASVMKHLDKSLSTTQENLNKLVESGDLEVMTLGKKNVYSSKWDLPV